MTIYIIRSTIDTFDKIKQKCNLFNNNNMIGTMIGKDVMLEIFFFINIPHGEAY